MAVKFNEGTGFWEIEGRVRNPKTGKRHHFHKRGFRLKREAEAAYVQASQALEQAHRNLLSTVTSDYNNVNAAISSVRAYELSVKSADSALKATQAGYDVGTRTMTDVLDATQNLYSAKQNAANARYTYILSRLSLRYDGGSLKVQDLEDVNSGLNKR